jgi:hypothetical protein
MHRHQPVLYILFETNYSAQLYFTTYHVTEQLTRVAQNRVPVTTKNSACLKKSKRCVSFLHKFKFPYTTLALQFISGNES